MSRILDPCCGSRMWWFDRNHPDVVYGDRRAETITVTDRSHGREDGTRVLRIEPDQVLDFRALPFPDGAFKLVAFDPPHRSLFGNTSGKKAGTHWMVFMKPLAGDGLVQEQVVG